MMAFGPDGYLYTANDTWVNVIDITTQTYVDNFASYGAASMAFGPEPILEPIPEPATFILLTMGFLSFLYCRNHIKT